jgi:hypothetical protein
MKSYAILFELTTLVVIGYQWFFFYYIRIEIDYIVYSKYCIGFHNFQKGTCVSMSDSLFYWHICNTQHYVWGGRKCPCSFCPLTCNLSPLTLLARIPLRRGVFNTPLCDKVCQWLATGYSGFLHHKTDHHDITKILLKVALNTITNNVYPEQQW